MFDDPEATARDAAPCEEIRPLLPRVADGEADPFEAMRTAQHLSDCTGCRILLARERRLAEILEEDLEDRLPVGDDFVASVMANLPKEPPPRPRKRARRSLKLALLAGLSALPAMALRAAEPTSIRLPELSLPRLDLADGGTALESVVGLGRVLLAGIDSLARIAPVVDLPTLGFSVALATAATVAAVAGASAATVVALASHQLVKRL